MNFGTKKPNTCASFVLEVGDEVCGIMIGCREGKEFYQYVHNSWLPEVKDKENISLKKYIKLFEKWIWWQEPLQGFLIWGADYTMLEVGCKFFVPTPIKVEIKRDKTICFWHNRKSEILIKKRTRIFVLR